ncbi:restriction endonuclease subunit S [Nesterenkonia marinintestina]|uniref:restriction endonuclease subunit S n=1 Tax=Nesterenkonia marinintestina TaxID=2979865 RepID=UPI0021C03297|nr:restriction endonuclease subunit S [Nesterenkonia sp. GX14115]
MTTLADVLDVAGVPERIVHPAKERFVTVKLNGGGAIRRVIGAGKTPVPFTGYRVQTGQFIYSRIDARNGAFAIVPAELDGAVVSKDFPVFEIRRNRIDDRYLQHFFASGQLEQQIRARSRGATNRRRIKEDEFLGFPIALPPLPEQRRIATILDHADALRAKRRQVLAHLDALTQSIFNDMFASTPQHARLKDIGVDFVSGKNVIGTELDAHPTNRVMKVSAISSGTFVSSESKPMPSQYSPPESHRVQAGDILFGRASGSLDLLGATTVVRGEPEDLFLPDKVWRLVVRPQGPVEAPYVLGVLRSPETRAFIRHNASGAAGVRNIGKAKLLECTAPLPSLEHQREFANRLEAHQKLRERIEIAAHADDELFVSLQSRAFRGEL